MIVWILASSRVGQETRPFSLRVFNKLTLICSGHSDASATTTSIKTEKPSFLICTYSKSGHKFEEAFIFILTAYHSGLLLYFKWIFMIVFPGSTDFLKGSVSLSCACGSHSFTCFGCRVALLFSDPCCRCLGVVWTSHQHTVVLWHSVVSQKPCCLISGFLWRADQRVFHHGWECRRPKAETSWQGNTKC